jgi:hypothetical protein
MDLDKLFGQLTQEEVQAMAEQAWAYMNQEQRFSFLDSSLTEAEKEECVIRWS